LSGLFTAAFNPMDKKTDQLIPILNDIQAERERLLELKAAYELLRADFHVIKKKRGKGLNLEELQVSYYRAK
jgi:hypothetical protein